MGFYWKDISGTIYWSNNLFKFDKDVIFSDPNIFFDHRIKKGLEKNFNNIYSKKPNQIMISNPPNYLIKQINYLKKNGSYWQIKNEGTIFWSNSKKCFNKDLIFNCEKEYFKHRKLLNLKLDWSGIINRQSNNNLCNLNVNKINDVKLEIKKDVKLDIKKDVKLDIKKDVKLNFKLSDLDRKIIKELDGLYWQIKNEGTIYWSNSKINIQKDIAFSKKSYEQHRRKRYLIKKLYSGILVLNSFEDKKLYENYLIRNLSKRKVKLSFNQGVKELKGCYWSCEGTVYWSNDENNIKPNVIFTSINMYNEHRLSKNLPKNWNGIKEIKAKNCGFDSKNIIQEKINNITNQNRNLILKNRIPSLTKQEREKNIKLLIKNNLDRRTLEEELNILHK